MIGPAALPTDIYWRRIEVISVHDGDTVTIRADLGFNTFTVHPLRMYGVNAPELKAPDHKGLDALDYVHQWFVDHTPHGQLMARFVSWDAYNPRFDGVLVCGQDHCLNDDLLSTGNAIRMKV